MTRSSAAATQIHGGRCWRNVSASAASVCNSAVTGAGLAVEAVVNPLLAGGAGAAVAAGVPGVAGVGGAAAVIVAGAGEFSVSFGIVLCRFYRVSYFVVVVVGCGFPGPAGEMGAGVNMWWMCAS